MCRSKCSLFALVFLLLLVVLAAKLFELGVVEPLDSFATVPQAKFNFSSRVSELPLAMGSVVSPIAFIDSAIRPAVSSKSMHLVHAPVSVVCSAIWAVHRALSIELVIVEASDVCSAIVPLQLSLTLEFVVSPVSLIVGRPIRPGQNTFSTFLISAELPFVHSSIRQHLLALAFSQSGGFVPLSCIFDPIAQVFFLTGF